MVSHHLYFLLVSMMTQLFRSFSYYSLSMFISFWIVIIVFFLSLNDTRWCVNISLKELLVATIYLFVTPLKAVTSARIQVLFFETTSSCLKVCFPPGFRDVLVVVIFAVVMNYRT